VSATGVDAESGGIGEFLGVVLDARPAGVQQQWDREQWDREQWDTVVVPLLAEPDDRISQVGQLLDVDLAVVVDAEVGATDVAAIRCTAVDALLVLTVGLEKGSVADHRRAGAALGRRCQGRRGALCVMPVGTNASDISAFVEGALLAGYRFRVSGPRQQQLERLRLLVDPVVSESTVVETSMIVAQAVHRARDATNTPSSQKTPEWFAEHAARLGAESGLDTQIWTVEELTTGGFGGVLAVGGGSVHPPRFVELRYRPQPSEEPSFHLVLVGKGITFDSGGLSLKPAAAMTTMKTDMAGGAAVIAVMAALEALRCPFRVTGLVAMAENMPSGSAMRPGDVITQRGGITVEVLNTDAEGRLVLADALAYADQQLAPDVIIDVATLTGAATVALGRRYGAVYSPDDDLAAELVAAGAAAGEPAWRMPLVADYSESLTSTVADVAQISTTTERAGSIAAALFLSRFVGDRRWAHLDIAGPARAEADVDEITRGGTGYGVRLLLRWISDKIATSQLPNSSGVPDPHE
jgi:leucyl aminopeptidase